MHCHDSCSHTGHLTTNGQVPGQKPTVLMDLGDIEKNNVSNERTEVTVVQAPPYPQESRLGLVKQKLLM